ncbi:response regulator transcription factor [Phenylobacterium sp.]|uniref:winged helix-turn-helix transcriptional regulator n=1 Tax=Phenylobacterium sp. TaxID=1871053 RepID=UPI00121D6A8B|nr:response regulator transcription factor [Phenylobacterium sp.]THD58511.1 MAG: response regulator transcription factor [Phenylobacterium sp.]
MRLLYAAFTGDPYIGHALAEAGHVVETAQDLAELLLLAEEGGDYDAVLMELAEPGPALAEAARAAQGLVVVAVLDRAAPRERAALLRAGVDAVFTRPAHFRELEARLAALSRLGRAAEPAPDTASAFSLDAASRTARLGGRTLRLTQREYALLDYLAARAGEVVAAQQVVDHVWGDAADAGPERLRSALARLRGRLAEAFGRPLIETVRGHGYRFDG